MALTVALHLPVGRMRGQTRDQRFAVFGDRVAALFDKAATLAGA